MVADAGGSGLSHRRSLDRRQKGYVGGVERVSPAISGGEWIGQIVRAMLEAEWRATAKA